jgi:arylsulfatase A-like enzyme
MEEWLASQPPSPFFVYIHFIPPHGPYDAPDSMKELFAGREPPNARRGSFEFPEVAARLARRNEGHRVGLAEWINLYDANLRWADWAVGQVEALLQGAGAFREALLIVTSDHGEAFGEHGYTYHGSGVYDELIHVPLLIKFPGDDPPVERISALTGTIDLLPTILDLLEIGYPVEQSQGVSLLPLLTGNATKVRDHIFARDASGPASYVVRGLSEALVLYEGGELQAFYDLAEDPGQTRNAIDLHAGRAADLLGVFRQFAGRQRRPPREFSDPGAEPFPLPEAPSIEFSEEERERLEALGYLK